MILLDRLRADPVMGPTFRDAPPGMVPLRVHQDVVDLAGELATRDEAKLRACAAQLFMPAGFSWFEWPMGEGDMAIMFLGEGDDVRRGHGAFYAWRYRDEAEPTMLPLAFDLRRGRIGFDQEIGRHMQGAGAALSLDQIISLQANVEKLVPVLLAFLALINSPKIVKRDLAKVERLNRKRISAGRYTYHPHHVVRLNVDRKSVRVGASDGGDGASRALHFVRAHLRLWKGQYILVQPHWRGDAKIGIVRPSYEIDRQTSRWAK